MSSIDLSTELIAWSNFTLKEETPDRIVFELWDKAHWNKIAKGINKSCLISNLTNILVLLGASIVLLFIVPKPWGTICFIVSIVLITLFAIYRIRLYQKTKLTSTPCAIFDRTTGQATGSDIDSSTFESVPWQVEIKQLDSLALKWDDPRFDLAMLQGLDSKGLLLFTVFGRSNELRKSAGILKTWLKIKWQDEIES